MDRNWVHSGWTLCLCLVAASASGSEYTLKSEDVTKLVIVGYKGDVELVASNKPEQKTLKVEVTPQEKLVTPQDQMWSWAPAMRRTGGLVEIRIEGPVSKKDWEQVMGKDQWPKYKVRVTGVPVDLALFWRAGKVEATGWTKSLDAHLLEGRLESRGGKGALTTSVQKGTLLIDDHTGATNISGLDLNAQVNSVTGDIRVRTSRGEIKLSDNKGLVSLDNELGKSNVETLTGALNFNNGRGELKISGVSGGIDGKTSDGPVQLSYSSGGEVQVESESGDVVVRVPSSAGPYAEATSEDGDLHVPSYFSVRNHSTGKTAKGRVRSGAKEGSIRVNSQKADIYLR